MKKVTEKYYPKYEPVELVNWIDKTIESVEGSDFSWCRTFDAGFIRGLKEVRHRIKLEE